MISTYRYIPLPLFFDTRGTNCYTFAPITHSDLFVSYLWTQYAVYHNCVFIQLLRAFRANTHVFYLFRPLQNAVLCRSDLDPELLVPVALFSMRCNQMAHCISDAQIRLVWLGLPQFVTSQPHVTVWRCGRKRYYLWILP